MALFSQKLVGVSLTDVMPPTIPGIISGAAILKAATIAAPIVKAAARPLFENFLSEAEASDEDREELLSAYDEGGGKLALTLVRMLT